MLCEVIYELNSIKLTESQSLYMDLHFMLSTFILFTSATVHLGPTRPKIRFLEANWLKSIVFGTCRAKRFKSKIALEYLGIRVVSKENSPPLEISVVVLHSGSPQSGVWSRVRIRIREFRNRIRILLLISASSSLHTPIVIMGPRRTHCKSRNGCPQCKARRLKVFRPDYLTPRSTRVTHATSVTNDIHAPIA